MSDENNKINEAVFNEKMMLYPCMSGWHIKFVLSAGDSLIETESKAGFMCLSNDETSINIYEGSPDEAMLVGRISSANVMGWHARHR